MKRIHLGVGALVWLVAWLAATTVRDRFASAPPELPLAPSRGATVAATCAGCHALDQTAPGVGPHLVGVVGRRAGSVEGYVYSAALRDSGLVWTPDRLREFLLRPEALVPGTRMALAGWSAQDADAVIDFFVARHGGMPAQAPLAQGRSTSP